MLIQIESNDFRRYRFWCSPDESFPSTIIDTIAREDVISDITVEKEFFCDDYRIPAEAFVNSINNDYRLYMLEFKDYIEGSIKQI